MHHNAPNPPKMQPGSLQPGRSRDRYAYHDPNSFVHLSTTLVHALADPMGADVTDVERSLFAAVDPDALDRIFAPLDDGTPRSSGHVAFSVLGYQVTVYPSGHIVITPPVPTT